MPRTKKGKNKNNLEIEKKFLLSRFPKKLLSETKHDVLDIIQYYFLIDGVRQRYRVTTVNGKTKKYHHTIKKALRSGVNEEFEQTVSKKEFDSKLSGNRKKYAVIKKTRYVIKYKGLKFEIDVFKGMNLVMLEVELPKLSFKFDFPPGLKSEIIMEVTKFKQFGNFNLSTKYERKN